jgi:hypothetical protein
MFRNHRRLKAIAFLFVLPILCPQQAHANSTGRGNHAAKAIQSGGDDGDRSNLPGDGGCTLTLGYWKTHNAHADSPLDIPWPISEETVLCGATWLDILNMKPEGDAWIILAHQWIAAKLNEASGASTDVLGGTLDEAEDLLTNNCGGLSGDDEVRALELAGIFDDYNNGRTGPGHCDGGITDCNGNGIDDATDITNGTSTDVNQNGIPDECEFSIKDYCNGTGEQNGGVNCPCGNEMPPGSPTGCKNSTGSGASLTATGNALVSNDTLVLAVDNVPLGKVAYFLAGTATGPGVVFGDGSRCIKSFVRLRKVVASSGHDTFPPPGSLPISQQLGITAGQTTYFQAVYRDHNGPCNSGANATNALAVYWGP